MKHLRVDWFKKPVAQKVICNLQKGKCNRDRHETEHSRPDAFPFWIRLQAIWPKSSWLVTPHIKRQQECGAKNGVGDLLNYLLQNAIKTADLESPADACFWTTMETYSISFDAWRLLYFWSNWVNKQVCFCGHTSETIFRETYLNYI